MIADDEEYTREGIVDNIDWPSLGIDEIIQTKDGLAALNAAKWYKPDIILTDIRMPRLDGISFAKEIVKINPKCKLIFITGFMEIDYLKSAIDVAAVAFIEKPLKIDSITEALRKATDALQINQKNQELSVNNVQSLKLRLINMLIFNDRQDRQLDELVAKVGIDAKLKTQCVVLKKYQKDKTIKPVEIEKYFKKSNLQVLVGEWIDQELIIVFLYNEKEAYRIPINYKKFSYEYKDLLIGVGFEVENLRRLKMSYDVAKIALNRAFYGEKIQLFEIEDVIPQENVLEPQLYSDFLQKLTDNPFELRTWSDNLYKKLMDHKTYHQDQIKGLMKSFIHTIIQENPELEIRLLESIGSSSTDMIISQSETIQELWVFYNELVTFFEEKMMNKSKYSKIINEVLKLVEQYHHQADFSVLDIAESMQFSAAHLNVLFKEEKEITIKQYLSEYRIEKAKQLLAKSTMKINEIATKCGYSSSNYFTKAFKEKTGIAPNEYRKQI